MDRGGDMSDRTDVIIKDIKYSDISKMVDAVFGSCVWIGNACYPDSECQIRLVEKAVLDHADDEG